MQCYHLKLVPKFNWFDQKLKKKAIVFMFCEQSETFINNRGLKTKITVDRASP